MILRSFSNWTLIVEIEACWAWTVIEKPVNRAIPKTCCKKSYLKPMRLNGGLKVITHPEDPKLPKNDLKKPHFSDFQCQ